MGRGLVLTLSTSGEGANSLLLRLHFSPHQSLLHCTLSPAIHFNGSNGIAYNRASNSPKQEQYVVGKEKIDRNKALNKLIFYLFPLMVLVFVFKGF
jgi:hypothetical protein